MDKRRQAYVNIKTIGHCDIFIQTPLNPIWIYDKTTLPQKIICVRYKAKVAEDYSRALRRGKAPSSVVMTFRGQPSHHVK